MNAYLCACFKVNTSLSSLEATHTSGAHTDSPVAPKCARLLDDSTSSLHQHVCCRKRERSEILVLESDNDSVNPPSDVQAVGKRGARSYSTANRPQCLPSTTVLIISKSGDAYWNGCGPVLFGSPCTAIIVRRVGDGSCRLSSHSVWSKESIGEIKANFDYCFSETVQWTIMYWWWEEERLRVEVMAIGFGSVFVHSWSSRWTVCSLHHAQDMDCLD